MQFAIAPILSPVSLFMHWLGSDAFDAVTLLWYISMRIKRLLESAWRTALIHLAWLRSTAPQQQA